MGEVNFCPVCGSEEIRILGKMQEIESIKVYACFKCMSGFYIQINSKKVVRGGNILADS
jgi:hypothetical protein